MRGLQAYFQPGLDGHLTPTQRDVADDEAVSVMSYRALTDTASSWRARLDAVEELLALETSIPIAARHATLGLCTNQPAPLAAAAARCVQHGLSDPLELMREVCARLHAARGSSASEAEQLQALAAVAGAAELARAHGGIRQAVRVALAGLLDGLQPLTPDESDDTAAAASLTPAVAAAAQRAAAALGAALGPMPLLGLLTRWLAEGKPPDEGDGDDTGDGPTGGDARADASSAPSAAAVDDAASEAFLARLVGDAPAAERPLYNGERPLCALLGALQGHLADHLAGSAGDAGDAGDSGGAGGAGGAEDGEIAEGAEGAGIVEVGRGGAEGGGVVEAAEGVEGAASAGVALRLLRTSLLLRLSPGARLQEQRVRH